MDPAQPDQDLAPGAFHLISAHEAVPRWRLHPAYFALCGAQVDSASMPEVTADCPNECGCEDLGAMAHCLACLHEALRQNRLAGVEAGDGSMAATRG